MDGDCPLQYVNKLEWLSILNLINNTSALSLSLSLSYYKPNY